MRIIDFLSVLEKSWLPNLVGLLGGALGVYSFVDNYVLTFKPRIFTANQVIFTTREDKNKRVELDQVILNLEISNHRNKYGLIYDFCVRLYVTDAINPDTIIYYSSEIVNKLSFEKSNPIIQDVTRFTPVSILPKSSRSITISFGEVGLRSKEDFNGNKSFYLELYYQTKPKGKWKFSKKLYLHNQAEQFAIDDIKIDTDKALFITLGNHDGREKIEKYQKAITTSIFKGAFQREKYYFINRWKYKLLKPLFFIQNFGKFFLVNISLVINWLKDCLFRKKAINLYSEKKPCLTITFGNKELKPITEQAINSLYEELSRLSVKINEKSEETYKISLKKLGKDRFEISRYNTTLLTYMMGDTTISVTAQTNSGHKVSYRLDLKKGIFNSKYWHIENIGFTSIKSFALRLLDSIMLHSVN